MSDQREWNDGAGEDDRESRREGERSEPGRPPLPGDDPPEEPIHES